MADNNVPDNAPERNLLLTVILSNSLTFFLCIRLSWSNKYSSW